MPGYNVLIYDRLTNEQRTFRNESPLAEHSVFHWSDGNYGCDCNRHIFFCRAADQDAPEDVACGDDRFVIDEIRLDDGSVVYREDRDA
jgi:hypothetical protein